MIVCKEKKHGNAYNCEILFKIGVLVGKKMLSVE
jgi:hypothetical protein